MPVVCLHFLLAVPYVPCELSTIDEEQDGYIGYKFEKQTFTCKIEFKLEPNCPFSTLRITFWHHIAELNYGGKNYYVETLIIGELCWFYCFVKQEFDIKDVENYYKTYFPINVSWENEKQAKTGKTGKRFYVQKDDDSIFRYVTVELNDQKDKQHSEELVSVKLENSEHYEKILKTIKKLAQEYEDENLILKPTEMFDRLPSLIQLSSIKVQAGLQNASKSKKTNLIGINVPGEAILSGKNNITNLVKYQNEVLPFVYSILSPRKMLSKENGKLYKPLSITLKNLQNLPKEKMIQNGFTHIKLGYNICDKYRIETYPFIINNTIKLNFTRTVFTNKIESPKLLEMINWNGLKIELIGLKAKLMTIIEKNGKKKETEVFEETVLCAALLDLSSLRIEPYRVNITTNFKSLQSVLKKSCESYQDKFLTTNIVNMYYVLDKTNTMAGVVSSCDTILSVSARMCYPLPSISKKLSNIFNRLLIKTVELNKTTLVLGLVSKLSPQTIKSSLLQESYDNDPKYEIDQRFILTGFYIHNPRYDLIYIEGNVELIHDIWKQTNVIKPEKGHVLYDMTGIFTTRILDQFMSISLIHPPQDILRNKKKSKNQIPVPAITALKLLDHLTNCISLRTATRNQLFPDKYCLRSLDLEFGTHTYLNYDNLSVVEDSILS